MALVEHHAMAPHVHRVLGPRSDIPGVVVQRLQDVHRRASGDGLLLTARLLQLVSAFDVAGIPLVTLKGPALAQQLYGDPGMRESLDLDLLVPARYAERAVCLLEEHGYRLTSALSWLGMGYLSRHWTELPFEGPDRVAVDLHWASVPHDYPSRIAESTLWPRVTQVVIGARPVPVLSTECQLLYLCIHGSRHCWTHLRWLCDLAMLLATSRVDWSDVDTVARGAKAERPLLLGLLLAHDLLGSAVPGDLVDRARTDVRVAALAGQVAGQLSATAVPPGPSSLQRTLFNVRLAPGPWSAVRHAAAMLHAPTEADARALRLPRPLVGLYLPFRAVRLAAKYGRRALAQDAV